MTKNIFIVMLLVLLAQPSVVFSQVRAFQLGEYALVGGHHRMIFTGNDSGAVRLDFDLTGVRTTQATGNWSVRHDNNGLITTLVIIWTGGHDTHRGRTDVYRIIGEGAFEGHGRISNSWGSFESWINIRPMAMQATAGELLSRVQGSWSDGNITVRITSNQLIVGNGNPANFHRVSHDERGSLIWFGTSYIVRPQGANNIFFTAHNSSGRAVQSGMLRRQ